MDEDSWRDFNKISDELSYYRIHSIEEVVDRFVIILFGFTNKTQTSHRNYKIIFYLIEQCGVEFSILVFSTCKISHAHI